jgi:hypothetical protein
VKSCAKYPTSPMRLGVSFKFARCEHTVTTLQCDSTNDNRRAQGGRVNQPARCDHVCANE